MNPIRRRPCADPGQKQVPGEWMTQKGIDSSRPVTEASRAKLDKAHERSHHRFRRIQPGLPRAMVLTAYFVLSRRRIRLVTVIRGLKVCTKPGRADLPPRI